MYKSLFAFFIVGLSAIACGPAGVISQPPGPQAPLTPVDFGATSLPAGYGFGGPWFELYFTDPLNPLAPQKTGGPDGPLVAAIDSAKLSVDAAIYSLSLNSVRDALLHAHQRGVQVRAVMESDNLDRSDPQILKEAGIPILGDRREGLMHNKFIVIDRAEVWTGSMNFTDSGAYKDNNNLICLRSTKVAADYGTEFNEMFVDDKFGSDKLAATPNPRVTVDGIPLDIYFSPDDNVQPALVDLLDNARSSIYFLAFSFTADPLADAIIARHQAGLVVAGVMEADQVASNIGSEYDTFRSAGVEVHLDGNPGLMHHKVMIIDGQIVVTGSYNFTGSAEDRNDENVVVIYNPQIAAQFMQEFQRVFAMARP